jgi:AAA15 family ATPase/GTPase
MITEIHISRFRGFKETTIGGFRRVNLIGGLNNTGKTALLEAILLGYDPDRSFNFNLVRRFGKERYEDNSEYLFFNYETNENIKIQLNEDEIYSENIYIFNKGKMPFAAKPNKREFPSRQKITVVSEANRLTSMDLGDAFDKAIIRGQKEHYITAIKAIEPAIIDVRTLLRRLSLQKQGTDQFFALPYWGDAVNKAAELADRFVNAAGGTVLIDEIENGIHYTKQPEIWKLIHIWAKQFDVQVFATTHSMEMSRAFAQATLDADDPDQGVFVELYRNPRTEEVEYLNYGAEHLLNTIENNLPFRGESNTP